MTQLTQKYMEYRELHTLLTHQPTKIINFAIPNSIDSILHSVLQTEKGTSDRSAIGVLKYIINWYKAGKDGKPRFCSDKLHVNVNDVCEFTAYSDKTIRRALKRLEEKQYIEREYRQTGQGKYTCSNVMFVDLNIQKIRSIIEEYIPSQKFKNTEIFNRKFVTPDSLIPVMTRPSSHHDQTYTILQHKNIISRSCHENFCKKDDCITAETKEVGKGDNCSNDIITAISLTKSSNRKTLQEFYPLTEKEELLLYKATGREFSLNFINQMLLKLAAKYPNHQFFSDKQFINYMTKVLANELRQAPVVNKEGYNLVMSQNDLQQLKIKQQREKYLTDVETHSDTTSVGRLRKKLAGRLNSDMAYELLTSMAISEPHKGILQLIPNDKFSSRVGEIIESEQIKEIILQEAKAIYGDKVDVIEVTASLTAEIIPQRAGGNKIPELSCVIKTTAASKVSKELLDNKALETQDVWGQEAKAVYGNKVNVIEIVDDSIFSLEAIVEREETNRIAGQFYETQTIKGLSGTQYVAEKDDLWTYVRRRLIKNHGEAIDNSWFSKLSIAKTEQAAGTIKLKAPTNFIRDWVQQHYGNAIERELKIIVGELSAIEYVS